MEPLQEGDSASRVKRQGKNAIEQMARALSTVLFGTEVPRGLAYFSWPKNLAEYSKRDHYVGIYFDHKVTGKNPSPRVLELTADDTANDSIVFDAVELGTEGRDFFNRILNQAIEQSEAS